MDSVEFDAIYRNSIANERVIVTLNLESKHRIWYLPKKIIDPHVYSSTEATDSQHHKHRANISKVKRGKKRGKYSKKRGKHN